VFWAGFLSLRAEVFKKTQFCLFSLLGRLVKNKKRKLVLVLFSLLLSLFIKKKSFEFGFSLLSFF